MKAVLGVVWRLFVALLLLGFVLDLTWPVSARDQFAAATAHSICAQRPQPHACAPDGHPSDFFRQLLEWAA